MNDMKLLHRGKEHTTDMTQGSILLHLVLFAWPLLLGNLFQQLYNVVDTWVVGNFVSNEAYSAVGSMAPAINTLISGFTGLSNGATVVISQFWGAKRPNDVRRTVSTSLTMTFALGVMLSAIGILLIPSIMDWMRVPASVRPDAVTYLTIYFGGLTGLLLYNMGAGILRAVGDSVRPFFFLIFSTVMNIGLDLLFVLWFHMGVKGVAWATVITQAIAAGMVLFLLLNSSTCVRWYPRESKIDRSIMKSVAYIGLPNAFHMMIMSFSNMFVFGYINSFGTDTMSAWTSYNRIEQFIALPLQSLVMACTTFTAQNFGKGDLKRAKKGVRVAFLISLALAAATAFLVVSFAPTIVRFFNAKPEVVERGAQFIRLLVPLYLLNCVSLIYSGALRGIGQTWLPTAIMLTALVGLRQGYLFVMANYISNTIVTIALSFPVGWFSCATGVYLCYRYSPLLRDISGQTDKKG